MAVQSQCQASRTGDGRLADLNPDEAFGSCPIRNWVQQTLAFARCRIPFPGFNVIRLSTSCVIRMHFLREAIDHEIPRQDFTQQMWIGLFRLFVEPSASTASVPSRSSRIMSLRSKARQSTTSCRYLGVCSCSGSASYL
jgi:hypothetical protein